MARKSAVIRADGILWLDIATTATRLGTTRVKIVERALAGEFRFRENKFGTPGWIAEPDIAPLRAAKLEADRLKADKPLRRQSRWPTPAVKLPSGQQAGSAISTKDQLSLPLPPPDPSNMG